MQERPAGALPNLPRARRERGIDGGGRRWLFAGRVPTAGQDQRPGAVLPLWRCWRVASSATRAPSSPRLSPVRSCRVGPGNFTPSPSQIRTGYSRIIRLVTSREGCRLPLNKGLLPANQLAHISDDDPQHWIFLRQDTKDQARRRDLNVTADRGCALVTC